MKRQGSLTHDEPKIAKDTLLSMDFRPGPFTVICGRGRDNYHHIGNRNFRALLVKHRDEYMRAPTRTSKSMMVLDLVQLIRQMFQEKENRSNPLGAFVRKDRKTGRWYDVGDACAREKVGHTLRDPERTKDSNDERRDSSSLSSSSMVSPNMPTNVPTNMLIHMPLQTNHEQNCLPASATYEYLEQRQRLLFAILMHQQHESIETTTTTSSNQQSIELPNTNMMEIVGNESIPSTIGVNKMMEMGNDSSIPSLMNSTTSLVMEEGDNLFEDGDGGSSDFSIFADVQPEDLNIDGIEL